MLQGLSDSNDISKICAHSSWCPRTPSLPDRCKKWLSTFEHCGASVFQSSSTVFFMLLIAFQHIRPNIWPQTVGPGCCIHFCQFFNISFTRPHVMILRPFAQYCANWEEPVHGLEGMTLLLANSVEKMVYDDVDKCDSQKYSRNHLRLLRHAFVVSWLRPVRLSLKNNVVLLISCRKILTLRWIFGKASSLPANLDCSICDTEFEVVTAVRHWNLLRESPSVDF